MANYAAQALAADAGFAGFPAERGLELFTTGFGTDKEDSPACASCHTSEPKNSDETGAGKAIDLMAPSVNTERFVELKKVEKWFGRNYKSVLGLECTPLEKATLCPI